MPDHPVAVFAVAAAPAGSQVEGETFEGRFSKHPAWRLGGSSAGSRLPNLDSFCHRHRLAAIVENYHERVTDVGIGINPASGSRHDDVPDDNTTGSPVE